MKIFLKEENASPCFSNAVFLKSLRSRIPNESLSPFSELFSEIPSLFSWPQLMRKRSGVKFKRLSLLKSPYCITASSSTFPLFSSCSKEMSNDNEKGRAGCTRLEEVGSRILKESQLKKVCCTQKRNKNCTTQKVSIVSPQVSSS